MDSTPLVVCDNQRIHSHKPSKSSRLEDIQASVGSLGLSCGCASMTSDQGEIVWLQHTPGKTNDRKGMLELLENPLSTVFGKLIGDKGYVSQALLS